MNLIQKTFKAIQFRINFLISFVKIRWKLSHLVVLIQHKYQYKEKICEENNHLLACMEWLCRAQDITGCCGISGGYSFEKGWLPPYPETTGYVIPSFIKYSEISGDSHYLERAIQMADWEISIQLANGATTMIKGKTLQNFQSNEFSKEKRF